jgi:hypothetical protein
MWLSVALPVLRTKGLSNNILCLLLRRPVLSFRPLVHLFRKTVMNGKMRDQLPSSCFTRILRVRYAPPDVDSRPEVGGIGLEVFGLEVFELAEKGHERWLYYLV